MAGLYLHIPFCRQACYYCDFHFSTDLSQRVDLVNAMVHELIAQKEYLKGEANRVKWKKFEDEELIDYWKNRWVVPRLSKLQAKLLNEDSD